MGRTNIDLDDEACQTVMRRYGLATKREAVNVALRLLAAEPLPVEEARRMRGAGWDGDVGRMRDDQPAAAPPAPGRGPSAGRGRRPRS